MRRLLITLALCVLMILPVFADSSGPNAPGTRADDGSNGGNEAWSNPLLVLASDDLYASAGCGCVKDGFALIHDLTHYLKATNFGFAIPSDSTVNGIVVEVERRASGTPAIIADSTVTLVVSGSPSGSNLAAVGTWLSTDVNVQYGSAVDLWGASLSPSVVNASNFGVVVAAVDQATAGSCPNDGIALIDHIRMSVFYTPAAPAPTAMPRRMIHIAHSPQRVEFVRRRFAA